VSEFDKLMTLVEDLIADYQAPRVKLDPGNGEFHLRTLVKMAQWAVENQPVKIGDTVLLDADRVQAIRPSNGWYPYKDLLYDEHEVLDVGFNGALDFWYFVIKVSYHSFHVPMSWAVKT
jgi:hypothetical protein